MSAVRHDVNAQHAAELAYRELEAESEEGGCICETCVVREILQAAWEHLVLAAREEAAGGPPMPERPAPADAEPEPDRSPAVQLVRAQIHGTI